MKIEFFGSSHGVPEPNRKCSSTMIEIGKDRYFIDMGSQSIEGLVTRNIPIESVKAIFITHMHGDHTNGLISFADLCSRYFKNADPIFYLPGDMERAKNAIEEWISANGVKMRPFEFRSVTEGAIYNDGRLNITARQTKHINASYSFIAEADGKRVFFSGDLRHGNPDDFIAEIVSEPIDLAIFECAHFDAGKYLRFLENNENVKKLCFNHYSDRFLPSILALKASLPELEIIKATDGMVIEL